MTLPKNANVEAAPNFLTCLGDIYQFFLAQDKGSADARLKQLKSDLLEAVAILAWSPASGRPARFMSANSAQSSFKNIAVRQLAKQTGLPNLREYIVGQHIVLYAHSETDVVLLAIKHQRQLLYTAETSKRT